ncbi:MAG: hypothetical protein H6619_04270 [Deltaproteobacteria bacterium]|nr:hypothetical protein [Deltaproteobacteria bacterium]
MGKKEQSGSGCDQVCTTPEWCREGYTRFLKERSLLRNGCNQREALFSYALTVVSFHKQRHICHDITFQKNLINNIN